LIGASNDDDDDDDDIEEIPNYIKREGEDNDSD
jgi:hypothetical protein